MNSYFIQTRFVILLLNNIASKQSSTKSEQNQMILDSDYFSSILTELEIDKNKPNHFNKPNRKVNSNRSKHSQSLNSSATKKVKNQFLEQKGRKQMEKAILRQKKKLYSQSIRSRQHTPKGSVSESQSQSQSSTKQNCNLAFSSANLTPYSSTKNSKPKKKIINQFNLNNSQLEFQKKGLSQMQQANCKLKSTMHDNFFRKHKRNNAQPQNLHEHLQISQIEVKDPFQIAQKQNQSGIQMWALEKSPLKKMSSPDNMSKNRQAKIEQAQQDALLISAHDQTFQTHSMQKQLEQSQKYAKQLEQKIEDLLFWKNQFPNVLFKKLISQSQNTQKGQNQSNDSKVNKFILERLLALQQEVYSLRKVKNSMQLKLHASQRKLVEEKSILKKKCAREINMWKKRFDDMARQNSILKGNLDETLTMQISRQQWDSNF